MKYQDEAKIFNNLSKDEFFPKLEKSYDFF